MKKLLSLLLLALSAASLHATVLFQDSTNYPYVNGPIAGQGQWYVISSGTASNDAVVTNNIIYLKSSGYDSIATPTNGFFSSTIASTNSFTWASFTLNVSKAPSPSDDGDYFCQLVSTNGNKCCNVFITSQGTVIPGTYRLAIANFSVSFTNLKPPVTFNEDLATNVTYTIVINYDTDVNDYTSGAALMIDPSAADYANNINGVQYLGDNGAAGYAYPVDAAVTPSQNNLYLTAIEFEPYINAGFSNLIVGTEFSDVYNTNAIPAPVFGVQPASGTNYSGNPTTFYSLAAGADLTYQWYSTTYGALSDGASYTGSQSNILTVNNLTGNDGYYVIASNTNGQSVASTTALETVITTPTPVFFAANVVGITNTNNLFGTTLFTNVAYGTGPITYQWYFEETNKVSATNGGIYTNFTALAGQTNSTISIYLADLTAPGKYFVQASNSLGTSNGPTNTLVEIAPLFASLQQLHQFINADISNLTSGTYYINQNTLVVSGWVSVYQGYGSSYSEFWIQDTNGYGCEVYLAHLGNTNWPPIGTHVTVSGPLESYYGALEMAPTLQSEIVTDSVPPIALHPFLGNTYYTNFVQSPYGSNSIHYSESLVTFTNVYLYGNSNGGAFGTGPGSTQSHSGVGGVFLANSYVQLYATVGAYDAVTNFRVFEVFQPTYDYNITNGGSVVTIPNPFDNQPIPTHCAQLTGILSPYSAAFNEIIPSRVADYAVSSPAPFTVTAGETNGALGLSWPAIAGNTYSVYSATNIAGPWTQEAYGIGYYPTNGLFTETVSNSLPAKYFSVTSP